MMRMNDFSVLLIEDDDHKLRAIHGFLNERFPDISMRVARSLTSALATIAKQRIDIALVDMSLPTFDFAIDKSGGGDPQGFGGTEILRFIEAEAPNTKAMVLTQHNEFLAMDGSTKSLADLKKELRDEFGDWFVGLSFYSGQSGGWRHDVETAIQRLLNGD